MNDAATAAVLRWISSHHDLELELVGPFGGGRQEGAWRVRSPAGDDLVLKWTTDAGIARRRDEAAAAVRRLRDAGYPTPAWVASGLTDVGWAWSVQALASGEPGTWATVPLADLVATIELQAGLGRPGPETWSSFAERVALADDGPRRHLAATEAGRALVAHVDEVLRGRGRPDLPSGDLVHGDLATSNVLVDGGRLSAVIDIDAIGSGTRAVDHAWLLREAFTVDAGDADKELVRAAGVEVAGPAVFAVCVAATALDIAVFEASESNGDAWTDLVDRLHALLDAVG